MEARTEPDVRGRNFNLRAYLAGGGATVALIAAAVLVFASLGAYVAFDGLPVGDGEDDAAQVAIQKSEPAAKVRSSRASGDARADGRSGDGPVAGSGGSGGASGDRDSGAASSGLATPPVPAEVGNAGSGPAPQPAQPALEPNVTQPANNQGGAGPTAQPVTDAAAALGDATGLPIDLPDAITAPLDETLHGVGNALDGVGNALDGVGNALDGVGALGQDLVGGHGD